MGKDQEPSIITAAKEHKARLECQHQSKTRLRMLLETKTNRKSLGGEGSAVVLRDRVIGYADGVGYSVELRGNVDFADHVALEFGYGDFFRTFVYRGSDCVVWDTHMDIDRRKGDWMGSPQEDIKRKASMKDLTQLNEAMDLFGQNVGVGVNRD